MADLDKRENVTAAGTEFHGRIERLDQSLDIMERHADDLARTEEDINESLRKWDREFKNDRLHSVPKPRKHTR